MNRREFVSRSVCAVMTTSLPIDAKLLSAQATAADTAKLNDAPGHWTLSGNDIRVSLADNGTIRAFEVKCGGQWEKVEFRTGTLAGPAWADVKMQSVVGSASSFAAIVDGIHYSLQYRIEGNRLAILAGIENRRSAQFAPRAARLVLGIDSEMRSYPSWNYRYFPTLLRCEKTHFWGYFMTPLGRILSIGSSDPIASYTINYNNSVWSPGDGGTVAPCVVREDADWSCDGGHLIFTSSLDVLHTLPLPRRHPQNLVSLQPGEQRNWTIFLQPVAALEEIKPALASSLSAPMVEADRYTVAAGESSHISIWAPQPVVVTVTAPDGSVSSLPVHPEPGGNLAATFAPGSGCGLYRLEAAQSNGRVSEACVSVRQPWSWYMIQARKETLIPQAVCVEPP